MRLVATLLSFGMVTCAPRVEVPAPVEVEEDGPTWVAPPIDSPTITATAEPPRCPDDRSWVQVSAGWVQTCGLHSDGCIECWGGAEYDGLVDTPDTGQWVDFGDDEPPDGAFASVTLAIGGERGSEHACALDAAGNVSCWGRNDVGQSIPPAGSFTALALYGGITCGLRTDTSVACWGEVDSEVLPVGAGYVAVGTGAYQTACAAHATEGVACWRLTQRYEDRVGQFGSVAVGGPRTCATATDASIDCWSPGSSASNLPVGLPTGIGFEAVCVSSFAGNGCAHAADGHVECWGEDYGEPPDTTFTQISCGTAHACGLTADHRVECWGRCEDGQCEVPP